MLIRTEINQILNLTQIFIFLYFHSPLPYEFDLCSLTVKNLFKSLIFL